MSVRVRVPVLCACLAACAPMEPLSKGKELSIASGGTQPELIVYRVTGSEVPAVGGATAGAATGLAAAAACPGFTILLCAPAFLFIGAGAGGYGGGTLGDMASDAPRRDATAELQRRLDGFGQTNRIDDQFLRVLVDAAWPHWQIVPESSRNAIMVHPMTLTLRAESRERIALEMRVIVVMQSETSTLVPTPFAAFTTSFWYESPAAPYEQWMEPSGDFLKTNIARAYESIAKQIVAALTTPPPS